MQDSIMDIELFTKIDRDLETRQYQILGALQKVKEQFRNNYIYPHLSSLIENFRILEDIESHITGLYEKFPRQIKKVDIEKMEIEHEVIFSDGGNLEMVKDLIQWARPYIEATINEGVSMFEYVDERLNVEQVGLMPGYTDEGYFFIPDNNEKKLCLFRYELSIFSSSDEKYRALKTNFVKKLELAAVHRSPNAVKMDLVKEYKELPNPATYAFNTELKMPFEYTLFPVAKRKLMRHLHEIN